MPVNVEEEVIFDQVRQMHDEALRLCDGEPGAEGVIACLCCGGEAHYHVGQSGRRLYVSCATNDCFRWSGALRYD